MPTYVYKARDVEGRAVSGTMEAGSEEDLINRLRKFSYTPVDVRESSREENAPRQQDARFALAIKAEDLVMFNMQLASMIDAGITLLGALNIIAKQIVNTRFKSIVEDVVQSVAGGSAFSDALKLHPKVFSHLFISMVRAGEMGGNLNIVLNRLAVYLEEQEELKQKIKGALFYPMILMVAGLVVILVIVTFVMPKFIVVFDKAGVPLPLPTRILYGFGVALKQFWYLIGAGMALAAYGGGMYIRSPRGRYQFDHVQLKTPVLGPLLRRVIVARFSRTLATLVESGVSMLQALDIMKDVVGNEVFRNAVTKTRQSVERGERLDQPLKMSGEFPGDAVHMISVGEETGKLGYMLNKVADYYETSVSYAVKKVTTLIEPVFIVIMGVVVGFIMASMLMPVFDMVKTLQR